MKLDLQEYQVKKDEGKVNKRRDMTKKLFLIY